MFFSTLFRTEIGAILAICPKFAALSDILCEEVGRIFGRGLKIVLPLHHQTNKIRKK